MPNQLYSYIHRLVQQLKWHEEQLQELEKSQMELKKMVESLKSRPPVNVERIEYHFDQLKIEHLDGTLNIGINPKDLEDMDEFSLPSPKRPDQTAVHQPEHRPLLNKLNHYLNEELPGFIKKLQEEAKIEFDPVYTNIIKEDIRKQLSGRVAYYSRKLSLENRSLTPQETEKKIFHLIVKDIEQAVRTFLHQFPVKGEGKNENDAGSDESSS